MSALPVPIDPAPVIDIAPLNETLATVTEIYGATLPESVAVLPAAAIVLGGIKLETALLNNEHWDNFWIGVGGKLNDVWHSVGGFLFGSHGAVSLDTVSGLIRLSMHVNMRATRQLLTGLAARTGAVEAALYKGVKAVATSVRATQQWTATNLQRVYVQLHGEVLAARGYAAALSGNLARGLDARIAAHTSALRAEMIRDILNPMRSAEANAARGLHDARVRLAGMEAQVAHHLVPELAAATLIGHEALKLAQAAKAWEDDCGEPMCQTVGPKTDWGKLLKRFGPTAIFALLAAIAAENPDKVEAIAEDLGHALGPVLASWAEDYLGLIGVDRGAIEREVGDRVGQFPGLPH